MSEKSPFTISYEAAEEITLDVLVYYRDILRKNVEHYLKAQSDNPPSDLDWTKFTSFEEVAKDVKTIDCLNHVIDYFS